MGVGNLRALILLTVVPAFGCTWGIYDGNYVPLSDGGTGPGFDSSTNCSGEIDSRGGSVSCDNGAITIIVPPGETTSTVHIGIARGESNRNGQGAVGQAYDVVAGEPFQSPVVVVFANMNVGGGPSDSLHVAASLGPGSPWTPLPYEVVHNAPQRVAGFTRQMSRFSLFITGGPGLDPAAACGACNSSCASTCCQNQGGSFGGPNPCGCTVGQGGRGTQYDYENCYDTMCGGAQNNACPPCFRACCQMANAQMTGSGSSGRAGSASCACINPSGDAESCFARCLQKGQTNTCNSGSGPGGGPLPSPPPISCPGSSACDSRSQACCISFRDGGPPSGVCQPSCGMNQYALHCTQSANCSGPAGGACCGSQSGAFCNPSPCPAGDAQLCATNADCGGQPCTMHSCGLGTCGGKSLPGCP